MGLSLPEEPKDIKELIRAVRARMPETSSAEGIYYDSISVWSFNKLPKYLWECWKSDLRKRGITWQIFLRILKLRTMDIIEWALHDKLEWAEFVKRVEHTISTYARKEGWNR